MKQELYISPEAEAFSVRLETKFLDSLSGASETSGYTSNTDFSNDDWE